MEVDLGDLATVFILTIPTHSALGWMFNTTPLIGYSHGGGYNPRPKCYVHSGWQSTSIYYFKHSCDKLIFKAVRFALMIFLSRREACTIILAWRIKQYECISLLSRYSCHARLILDYG